MKKYFLGAVAIAVVGFIAYDLYSWPSAAAETGFMRLCEADYMERAGVDRVRVKYASATTGRFGKWQVSLVLERVPDTSPPRNIYCMYDRAGLTHIQDVRAGFVYNRDDES